jgi:hypothetical protein
MTYWPKAVVSVKPGAWAALSATNHPPQASPEAAVKVKVKMLSASPLSAAAARLSDAILRSAAGPGPWGRYGVKR